MHYIAAKYLLISFQTTNFEDPVTLFTEEQLNEMNLRYYDDKIHRACFKLPRFASKELWN